MSETKLTKQSEAILEKLEVRMVSKLLTEEEMRKIRLGLALADSMGVFSRLIVGVAATVGAVFTLLNFWPSKGGGN